MKNQWLNVVLLLTNRIYERKQLIIARAGLKAVTNIFVLIILEIILAVFSLPLYLTLRTGRVTAFFGEKGSYAKVAFDYNLRRVLTLTGVAIFAAVWATKLALILSVPAVYGPLQLYSVTDFRPADISAAELIDTETGIEKARVVGSILPPKLVAVEKIKGGNYVFSGSGQPNSTVVLLLSGKQTAIYSAETDINGDWQLTHSQAGFKLSEGNHAIIVFDYNKKLGVRSEASPEQYFKVTTNWYDYLLSNIDVLANWSVVIILILGVFLTFLTI